MKVGYIRVSTLEQNEARQYTALDTFGIEKMFVEKISGKNTDRPEFKSMMEFIREGDTLYVEDWSRLSRSTTDLLHIIDTLNKRGIQLVSVKENFDTSTPTGKLMLGIIASINQFERENMLDRQKEGIAEAKKCNKYRGRKCKEFDNDAFEKVIVGLANKSMTVSDASRMLGVTRATVYNILKRHDKNEGLLNNYTDIRYE